MARQKAAATGGERIVEAHHSIESMYSSGQARPRAQQQLTLMHGSRKCTSRSEVLLSPEPLHLKHFGILFIRTSVIKRDDLFYFGGPIRLSHCHAHTVPTPTVKHAVLVVMMTCEYLIKSSSGRSGPEIDGWTHNNAYDETCLSSFKYLSPLIRVGQSATSAISRGCDGAAAIASQ
eukprot:6197423-Pleurochrysis_carterae.AAC.1